MKEVLAWEPYTIQSAGWINRESATPFSILGRPAFSVGKHLEAIAMSKREDWIRERAYALWEGAGRPEHRDGEHWQQATAEWEAGSRKAQADKAGEELISDLGPAAKVAPN